MLYQDDLITEIGAWQAAPASGGRPAGGGLLHAQVGPAARRNVLGLPNGGKRHKLEAARMTRLGVRAGIPDIHIVYQGRLHCLELKAARPGSLVPRRRR